MIFVDKDSGKVREERNLCGELDGHKITNWGYGVFDADSAAVNGYKTSLGGTEGPTDGTEKTAMQNAFKDAFRAYCDDVEYTFYCFNNSGNHSITLANNKAKLIFDTRYGETLYSVGPTSSLTEPGDMDHPYRIRNINQLDNIESSPDWGATHPTTGKHFLQTHDVNATNYNTYTSGDMGPDSSYSGGYYRILELYVGGWDIDAGLFRYSKGTTLENIILYSPSGTAKIETLNHAQTSAGGLIAYLQDDNEGSITTTIRNCIVAGYTIYSERNSAGGLVGYIDHNCVIENSAAVVTIQRNKDWVDTTYPNGIGGFIGPVGYYGREHGGKSDSSPSLTIRNSYAGGTVTEGNGIGNAGGFYGGNKSPGALTIENSYSYLDLGNSGTRYAIGPLKNTDSTTITPTIIGSVYYLDTTARDNNPGELNGDYYSSKTYDELKATDDDLATFSYTDSLTPKEQPDGYPFRAVVKDKDGNLVHYGELPTNRSGHS